VVPTAPNSQFYSTLKETPAGALVAEDLFAGNYELSVHVYDASGTLRAEAQIPFTVPAVPLTGTLDLGEIVLTPVP
jgi:hypothetical protein